MRYRLLALFAVMTATLGLSSTALAASRGAGIVLSVNSHRHLVQVVDSTHVVHAYRYGRLNGVRRGSRITFSVSGVKLSSVRTVGKATRVSFYAKVVKGGSKGLTLRLADGQKIGFTNRQLKHAKATTHTKNASHVAKAVMAMIATAPSITTGNVTINIAGLQPGDTVLITEATDGSGALTITIQLTAGPGGGTVTAYQASGVIANVANDSFDVTTADGSTLHLHLAADTLAALNLSVCDDVTVSYHQDASMFIADTVNDSGASTTASCSGDGSGGDNGSGDGGNQADAVGAITAVSATSITVDGGDQGSLTFTVSDPSLTAGFLVGDSVDVTYEQSADGSTLIADDVQYNDQPTSGVVTSVGSGSVTIVDDNTGATETFTADPSLLDGVQVGDEVEVNYYPSAAGQTLDQLTDDGPAGNGNGPAGNVRHGSGGLRNR
jgi:hypothetical protein